MSNSGVNTSFAKCFIFFMAVVILIQGSIYLGLSIWGITLRQCSDKPNDVSNKPFQFAIDLIYFMNKVCQKPSIIIPDYPSSIALEVDFNKAEPIGIRTSILMLTYAVISSLWILTSLAIITALCGAVTKTVNALCFWPWFLVVIAGCILDVVATTYHIYDIINTTSVTKTFGYLSITTSKEVLEFLSKFNAYFITPAVIMTCISSRVFLIWLLNMFGAIFCLSLSNTLSKRQTHQHIPQVQTQEQQQPQQVQLEPQGIQEKQTPVAAHLEPQLIKLSTPPQENQNTRPYSLQSSIIPAENINPTTSASESKTNSDVVTTYRNTETHPDRLNYPLQRPPLQYQQEFLSSSPLNNRYSTANDGYQFSIQNQRISEELRGQLPWSYTNMPLSIPKKPQVDVYPKIPTPDYSH